MGLYQKWMYAWETRLTTRDTNRLVRPLEWGMDWAKRWPLVNGDFLDCRDGECGGFAGAGLGLANDVLSLHEDRDGFGLNRSGLLETKVIDGFEQFRRKAEFGE